MKQEEKKPREFWIEIWSEQSANSPLVIQRPVANHKFEKSIIGDEIIHVIEYNAYEQLKAKLEKACEALRFYGEP